MRQWQQAGASSGIAMSTGSGSAATVRPVKTVGTIGHHRPLMTTARTADGLGATSLSSSFFSSSVIADDALRNSRLNIRNVATNPAPVLSPSSPPPPPPAATLLAAIASATVFHSKPASRYGFVGDGSEDELPSPDTESWRSSLRDLLPKPATVSTTVTAPSHPAVTAPSSSSAWAWSSSLSSLASSGGSAVWLSSRSHSSTPNGKHYPLSGNGSTNGTATSAHDNDTPSPPLISSPLSSRSSSSSSTSGLSSSSPHDMNEMKMKAEAEREQAEREAKEKEDRVRDKREREAKKKRERKQREEAEKQKRRAEEQGRRQEKAKRELAERMEREAKAKEEAEKREKAKRDEVERKAKERQDRLRDAELKKEEAAKAREERERKEKETRERDRDNEKKAAEEKRARKMAAAAALTAASHLNGPHLTSPSGFTSTPAAVTGVASNGGIAGSTSSTGWSSPVGNGITVVEAPDAEAAAPPPPISSSSHLSTLSRSPSRSILTPNGSGIVTRTPPLQPQTPPHRLPNSSSSPLSRSPSLTPLPSPPRSPALRSSPSSLLAIGSTSASTRSALVFSTSSSSSTTSPVLMSSSPSLLSLSSSSSSSSSNSVRGRASSDPLPSSMSDSLDSIPSTSSMFRTLFADLIQDRPAARAMRLTTSSAGGSGVSAADLRRPSDDKHRPHNSPSSVFAAVSSSNTWSLPHPGARSPTAGSSSSSPATSSKNKKKKQKKKKTATASSLPRGSSTASIADAGPIVPVPSASGDASTLGAAATEPDVPPMPPSSHPAGAAGAPGVDHNADASSKSKKKKKKKKKKATTTFTASTTATGGSMSAYDIDAAVGGFAGGLDGDDEEDDDEPDADIEGDDEEEDEESEFNLSAEPDTWSTPTLAPLASPMSMGIMPPQPLPRPHDTRDGDDDGVGGGHRGDVRHDHVDTLAPVLALRRPASSSSSFTSTTAPGSTAATGTIIPATANGVGNGSVFQLTRSGRSAAGRGTSIASGPAGSSSSSNNRDRDRSPASVPMPTTPVLTPVDASVSPSLSLSPSLSGTSTPSSASPLFLPSPSSSSSTASSAVVVYKEQQSPVRSSSTSGSSQSESRSRRIQFGAVAASLLHSTHSAAYQLQSPTSALSSSSSPSLSSTPTRAIVSVSVVGIPPSSSLSSVATGITSSATLDSGPDPRHLRGIAPHPPLHPRRIPPSPSSDVPWYGPLPLVCGATSSSVSYLLSSSSLAAGPSTPPTPPPPLDSSSPPEFALTPEPSINGANADDAHTTSRSPSSSPFSSPHEHKWSILRDDDNDDDGKGWVGSDDEPDPFLATISSLTNYRPNQPLASPRPHPPPTHSVPLPSSLSMLSQAERKRTLP